MNLMCSYFMHRLLENVAAFLLQIVVNHITTWYIQVLFKCDYMKG